jgi:hypothetical protein
LSLEVVVDVANFNYATSSLFEELFFVESLKNMFQKIVLLREEEDLQIGASSSTMACDRLGSAFFC